MQNRRLKCMPHQSMHSPEKNKLTSLSFPYWFASLLLLLLSFAGSRHKFSRERGHSRAKALSARDGRGSEVVTAWAANATRRSRERHHHPAEGETGPVTEHLENQSSSMDDRLMNEHSLRVPSSTRVSRKGLVSEHFYNNAPLLQPFFFKGEFSPRIRKSWF